MNQVNTLLQTWGEKITDALKAAIPPQKDTEGILKQSIRFSLNFAGFPMVFELSMADYYKFIDEGRLPGHFPPPDVLKAWIVNKNLNLQPYETLKKLQKIGRQKTALSQQSKINQLSFLIGRKIAKDGIAPTHFYSSTITPEVLAELETNLSIAFKQDVLVMLAEAL